MTNHALAFKSVVEKLQIKETFAILTFSVLFPFLIHFIPTGTTPAGAVLLPIFIAPFIALLFFRWHVTLITGLLSPMLNHIITGMPVFSNLTTLTSELVLFVLFTSLFFRIKAVKYLAAPISGLIAIAFVHLLFSKASTLSAAVINGIPGLLILTAINYLAFRFVKK